MYDFIRFVESVLLLVTLLFHSNFLIYSLNWLLGPDVNEDTEGTL